MFRNRGGICSEGREVGQGGVGRTGLFRCEPSDYCRLEREQQKANELLPLLNFRRRLPRGLLRGRGTDFDGRSGQCPDVWMTCRY
ncbi:unnamed protein product, partial [Iphiclides podalirius]